MDRTYLRMKNFVVVKKVRYEPYLPNSESVKASFNSFEQSAFLAYTDSLNLSFFFLFNIFLNYKSGKDPPQPKSRNMDYIRMLILPYFLNFLNIYGITLVLTFL